MNVEDIGPLRVRFATRVFSREHTSSVQMVMTTLVDGVASGIVALNIFDAFNFVIVPVIKAPGNENSL
jgi:hypothetical protein